MLQGRGSPARCQERQTVLFAAISAVAVSYAVEVDDQRGDRLRRSYDGLQLASDRLQALEVFLKGLMVLTTPSTPGLPADGSPLIAMGVKGGAFEIVNEVWTAVPKSSREGLEIPLAALLKGYLSQHEAA